MDICRPPALRSSSTQPCRWQISTCPHTSRIMLCPYCFVAGWRSISYSTSMGTCLCARTCWKAFTSPPSSGHALRSGSPLPTYHLSASHRASLSNQPQSMTGKCITQSNLVWIMRSHLYWRTTSSSRRPRPPSS